MNWILIFYGIGVVINIVLLISQIFFTKNKAMFSSVYDYITWALFITGSWSTLGIYITNTIEEAKKNAIH